MRAGVEFIGFASVSLLAHLAVFAATAPDGAASGGSDGGQEITIASPVAGADEKLAALVRQWDRPVEVPQPAEPLETPPPAETPPDLPALSSQTPRAAIPSLPQLPDAEALPQITAELPALFDTPQTRDTPRPRARPEPQRAPSQSSAPRAARASGQANQGQAGAGRAAQQSGAAMDTSLLVQWGGGIRAAIQRRQSNPGTRAQGTVQLRLQVNASGGLVSVSIAQSSGNSTLDRAAISAVQRASLPRAPSGVTGTHHFNLPLNYR